MAGNWLVQRGDRTVGPFSTAQLRRLVATGKLKESDRLRNDGMSRFVRAGAVPGLFPDATPQQTAPQDSVAKEEAHSTEMPPGTPAPSNAAGDDNTTQIAPLPVPENGAKSGVDIASSPTPGTADAFCAKPKRQIRATPFQALMAMGLSMGVGIGIGIALVSATRDGTNSARSVTKKSPEQSPPKLSPSDQAQALSRQGFSMSPDLAESAESYENAANRGDSAAMVSLAKCYQTGRGVAKDLKKSVEWYEKAAAAGNSLAMNNLGCCYLIGSGVKKNAAKAVEYLQNGSNAGNRVAMRNLGSCYQRGVGVPRELAYAVTLFESAAKLGDPESMRALAHCYERGMGVRRNAKTAADWYLKGANAGDAESMHALAICYSRGRGVPIDRQLAKSWGDKSIAAGYKPATQQARVVDPRSFLVLMGLLGAAGQLGAFDSPTGHGDSGGDLARQRGDAMRSSAMSLEDEARRDAANGNWQDAERKAREADSLRRSSF